MTRTLSLLALVLLAACGSSGTGAPDAGASDAGTDAIDAGRTDTDAGSEPTDAGEAADAGESIDAGEQTPDAGPSLGLDIFWNGGFEQWDEALPDRWLGLQSNLSEDAILKDTTNPFQGDNACVLANPSDSHRRFTTAPISARAGRYLCRYHVRGEGEIRTARYDTEFSSYTPSGYHQIDTDAWEEKTYEFTLAEDVFDTFELVFSVRNTGVGRGHLALDEVSCRRKDEPCDAVTCEEWAECENATATCEPRFGRCAGDGDCNEWERCNADHRCEVRDGRCNTTPDCAVASPEAPVCDRTGHTCEAGDPCAEIICTAPRTCSPATATCVLPEGACYTTADCKGPLPACDGATKTCVAANHSANIFPNGGFEAWSVYDVPYLGEHLLPDAWYGLDIPGSSEIDPENVREYTAHVHGGAKALQLVGGEIADRFTSEAFDVPAGRYTCSYRLRGKGTMRHRHYSSGGWSPYTDFVQVDSETWVPVVFSFTGNVRDFRLILYPSRTDPARDHLQVDDVVCTKDG